MSSFNSVNFVSNIEPALACFYGLFSKTCLYNPKSAPIYFTLGEAVSALALIFAALQLANPVNKLTLKIKEWYLQYMVWILSILGLIAILVASFVNQIPYLNPPFNYPIFWEQIGFIFFISAPISYLFISSKSKDIYNSNRAERFYHIILQMASNGKQKDLEATITIVWENLEKLTTAIKKINPYIDEEITNKNRAGIYAKSLLNLLLSEKSVADYIVTNRLEFLFALINQIKEKNILQRDIGMGFQKLVSRLYENPESYLYKQLDYQGVTLYAPIYDTLFGDPYFLSEFAVLGMWHGYFYESLPPAEYLQVFLKALSTAIKTNKFHNDLLSPRIANSLYELTDYVRSVTFFRKTDSKEKLDSKLMNLEFFFGRDFPQAFKDAVENQTISNYEREAKKGRRFQQSLTASYAECIVILLGHIANMDDRKMESHRAMSLDEEFFSIHNDAGLYENIRKCFLEHLWEKIKDNVERGHFPAVLRIYIQLMYWNNPSMPEWRKLERKKLIEFLNKELKPRILKNELMANYKDKKETVLLPDDIKFDRKTKKYFMYFDNGTKKEFK